MKRRGRALRRRYGRAADWTSPYAQEISAVEKELQRRGYKDAARHAHYFVTRGHDLAQLLETEKKYGKFPVSSPAGPLTRKRTHPRYRR